MREKKNCHSIFTSNKKKEDIMFVVIKQYSTQNRLKLILATFQMKWHRKSVEQIHIKICQINSFQIRCSESILHLKEKTKKLKILKNKDCKYFISNCRNEFHTIHIFCQNTQFLNDK